MNSTFQFILCAFIALTAFNATAKPKQCHSCMPSHMDVLVCNEYPCYPTQTQNGGCKNVDCNKEASEKSKAQGK